MRGQLTLLVVRPGPIAGKGHACGLALFSACLHPFPPCHTSCHCEGARQSPSPPTLVGLARRGQARRRGAKTGQLFKVRWPPEGDSGDTICTIFLDNKNRFTYILAHTLSSFSFTSTPTVVVPPVSFSTTDPETPVLSPLSSSWPTKARPRPPWIRRPSRRCALPIRCGATRWSSTCKTGPTAKS